MSRRTRASLRHWRRVEQTVNQFAPLLWAGAARPLAAWLRRILRAIRPQVEGLVLEQRALEAEILYLTSLIAALQHLDAPPDTEALVLELAEHVALQYGFLPADPRRQIILKYTTRILEDDLSSFWRTLTSPETLARRLVRLRSEGRSYVEMSRAIAAQYQTEFYRAERLVRSSYNTSANYAHYQDLLNAGAEEHTWLSARDARVRSGQRGGANHRAMDGQTVRLGQPFLTPRGYRLMFPGDRSQGAPADEVVNCRCSTA